MTLIEKIFAAKLKREKVSAGETIFAPLDLVVGTDITVPLSVNVFRQIGAERVFDPGKIVFINDHFVPAKDIAAANLAKSMKLFAQEQGIYHFFDVGRSGICHITIPEEGLVKPGDIIVGADSHTCTYGALGAFAAGIGSTDMAAAWATGELWFRIPTTIKVIFSGKLNPYVSGKDLILYVLGKLGPAGALYKALEFCGPVIDSLDMADRFTICNMAVECGAKTGLIAADNITTAYLEEKGAGNGVLLTADNDAIYERVLDIDVSRIEPLLAAPFDPSNVQRVKDFEGTPIDQVVIGSCTNGRIEDFRVAHTIIKGQKVNFNTRLIVIPGSPRVLKQMVSEGILVDFIDAGAVIGPCTCGPCIGGHMGVLAKEEVGLYTTNRNFVGRNGASDSRVFLCNPAVAAFSALHGKIRCPGK